MYSDSETIDHLKCGICITSLSKLEVKAHPILKILICQDCFNKFDMVDNENLCYWCKISEETIVKCIKCSSVYCRKCLQDHLDADIFNSILKKKQWLCFVCDQDLLSNKRNVCVKVLHWLSNNKRSDLNHTENMIDEEDLSEIKDALISKCSQLSEIGFQLIKKSSSHMAIFQLQELSVSSAIEALNYQNQLMLSVMEMCKTFNLEVDKFKKKLESSNENVSEEPELLCSSTNVTSCNKNDSKKKDQKFKKTVRTLSTESSNLSSKSIEDDQNNDLEDEAPLPSNIETLEAFNVAELSNSNSKNENSDSDDNKNLSNESLFSQETVDLHIDDNETAKELNNSTAQNDHNGDILQNSECDGLSVPVSNTNGRTDEEYKNIRKVDSSKMDIVNDTTPELNSVVTKNHLNGKLTDDSSHNLNNKNELLTTSDSPKSKSNFLSAVGLYNAQDLEQKYIDLFKKYNHIVISSDEDSDVISETEYDYTTPKALRDVGYITTSLPKLPSENEESEEDHKQANETYPAKKMNLPPCSIILKKIDEKISRFDIECGVVNNQTMSETDKEEHEIDRLTNLNNIGMKRKRQTLNTDEIAKSDVKKSRIDKRITSDDDSNSTMSLSFPNNEDSEADKLEMAVDENKCDDASDNVGVELMEETSQQEDLLLLSDSDIDSDLIKDSDEECTSNIKEKKEKPKKAPVKREPGIAVKLPKKVAKWRNDPLLKGIVDSDTDSSDAEMNDKAKRGTSDEMEKEDNESADEVEILNEKESSDSDFENEFLGSCIDINSNDSDSSIEFIKEFKTIKLRNKKTPISLNLSSDCETDSEEEISLSFNKGRKNIRTICSDAELNVLTKKAMLVEKARQERITNKMKMMAKVDSTNKLILDVDENLHPTITVHPNLVERLKDHQKHGIQFMFDCCYESVNSLKKMESGSGCILAHSMGLGKTYQVVALVHTLFAHDVTNTKHVLIVCPLSVVFNWREEFEDACKKVNDDLHINIFCISDKCDFSKRYKTVRKWNRRNGILIMGYDAYQRLTMPKENKSSKNILRILHKALVEPGPDLVVLDEGHLLKNGEIARTKALMEINTKRRIVLTGTPLQNNLKEYYFMVNFVKPNYLGSLKEYSNRFMNPISNGQYHDSTEKDIKEMKKRSHILYKLLNIFVIQRYGLSELEKYLPKRYDHVLFIDLHQVQIDLYTKYIAYLEQTPLEKKNIFNNFHFLQFICSHPVELKIKEKSTSQKVAKSNKSTTDIPDLKEVMTPNWWLPLCPSDFETNLDYGPKYKIMMAIIRECEMLGDKVLIFSNSMIDLDTIEHFLHKNSNNTSQWKRDFDYFRMDGSVALAKRSEMCNYFNNPINKRCRLFLLSYRVACLGINLMAANRVILMNVSWNPAIDSQSIFRMYRFGQTKECFVYRLVAMGAMEEVLYERQVTKLAIARRVIDETQVSRHYSSIDLQLMYRFNFQANKSKPVMHIPKDPLLKKMIETYPTCIYKYHEHQSLLEDRPDEGLNADEMKSAWEEYYKEGEKQETEHQKKQAKILNGSIAGPSRAQNVLPPNTTLPDLTLMNQFHERTNQIPNTLNNSNNKIPNQVPVRSNMGPRIPQNTYNSPNIVYNRTSNFQPNSNSTPVNNSSTLSAQSAPRQYTSLTRVATGSRTGNSTINPFYTNRKDSEGTPTNTVPRVIPHEQTIINQGKEAQSNNSITDLDRQRWLHTLHGNTEITLSTIGEPQCSDQNHNSDVVIID